jgi:hypothetical protein
MPNKLPRTRLPSVALLLLAHCHATAEPAPQTASATSNVPAPTASATPTDQGATSAGAAASAGTSSSYAMCGGQHVPNATASSRMGPVQVQLAPAFLDEMAACRAEDGLPKELISRATEGHINAKGDCEFADIGVTCHYHSGSEFIQSSVHQQTLGQGELHCIFPSDDPKSPRVYGGHVMCKDHALGEPHGAPAAHAAHAAHEGEICSANLLHQLEPCTALRCCDDGTLTNPISELAESHRNDIRPDFRICDESLDVDCELLAVLTVHPANSPGLGGIGTPAFAVADAAGAPKGAVHRHQ